MCRPSPTNQLTTHWRDNSMRQWRWRQTGQSDLREPNSPRVDSKNQ
ncbi:Uncharacterised protein [Vibrio cholerae]|nr:Uncharacterised protein [Vibrio cholerae]